MKLNKKLLDKFENTNSKILVVTKYLEKEDTIQTIDYMEQEYNDIFEGVGENRLESMANKSIEKEKMHFIGNLQTKQIKDILDYCDTIHSVDNIKHILKLEEICTKKNTWVKIFIQINIDNTKDGGIIPEKIPEFLSVLATVENVSLVGFSAIGKEKFTKEEKEKEFDMLLELRKKYIPNGLISAGTSIDYEIALEKGIDIIRIGRKLYE